MKLIYLSHWRLPSEKTMTPLMLKTCAHFARRGWEVELWVPRRRTDYKAGEDVFALYGIEPRFTIRRIGAVDLMHSMGKIGFVLLVLSFNIAAWRRLQRERAVIYAHDIRDVMLPVLTGLPTFVEIHDFYESSLRPLSAFVFRRVRGLIVTNTHKIESIARRWGVPKERMLRQPNAVEVQDFTVGQTQQEARDMLGLPVDTRLALYTGHLFSWKGVHTLADAAAYVPAGVRIVFVGGTERDRRDMETYVAERKLSGIIFVPHQMPSRIPLYLRAADVLVLPNTAKEEASRVETSPVKLFEYLAAQKPIVASDLPSIREIVSERQVFFARPDDPRDFARAIGEAIGGDPQRMAAAHALARKHSWEMRAEAIDTFMRRFL